jgi:hypothetical protein
MNIIYFYTTFHECPCCYFIFEKLTKKSCMFSKASHYIEYLTELAMITMLVLLVAEKCGEGSSAVMFLQSLMNICPLVCKDMTLICLVFLKFSYLNHSVINLYFLGLSLLFTYLFIWSLCKKAVSSLDYVVMIGKMVREYYIGKENDCGLTVHPLNILEELLLQLTTAFIHYLIICSQLITTMICLKLMSVEMLIALY